jgi:hypothetical protein
MWAGRGCGAIADHIGGDRLHDLDVEIGRRELQLPLGGFDHHIGQDRDRIPAFDDTLDVAQSLQKGSPFNVDFHRSCAWFRPLQMPDFGTLKAPRNPLI